MIAQAFDERQQFQELLRSLIGEPPNYVGTTSLVAAGEPEMMSELARRPIKVAQAESLLAPNHLGARRLRGQQIHGPVSVLARETRGMNSLPIVRGEPPGDTVLPVDVQLRGIKSQPVLVVAGPEAQLVIIALFEDTQPSYQDAFFCSGGHQPGSQLSSEPLFARHAAGRHPGHGIERERFSQITDGSWHGEHQTFGLSVDLGHQRAAGLKQQIKGLPLLWFVFHPGYLAPDPLDGGSIGCRIVFAKRCHQLLL